MIMYNAKIYITVCIIGCIMIIPPLIVSKCKKPNKSSIDENKIPKIETISNYKSSIIIEKNFNSANSNYFLIIKKRNWICSNIWEIDKIYVTKYEYDSVSLGDTIK